MRVRTQGAECSYGSGSAVPERAGFAPSERSERADIERLVHPLRNALTPAFMSLSALSRADTVSASDKQVIDRARASVERACRMIDEMVARMDAHPGGDHDAPVFELSAALTRFEKAASLGLPPIRVDVPDVRLRGNREYLERAVEALAQHLCRCGSIEIAITAHRCSGHSSLVLVISGWRGGFANRVPALEERVGEGPVEARVFLGKSFVDLLGGTLLRAPADGDDAFGLRLPAEP